MAFALLFIGVGPVILIALLVVRLGKIGQSWGHQAVGVRVVDAGTGNPIGAGRAFGRLLIRGLAAFPCYLGLAWALWEPRRRGWHDMAMNTIVVRASSIGPGSSSSPSSLAAVPRDDEPFPAPGVPTVRADLDVRGPSTGAAASTSAFTTSEGDWWSTPTKPPATPSGSSAGWHSDPHGRHELRYWDGVEWTAHVSDGGIPSYER
jgi:hypothetical protein